MGPFAFQILHSNNDYKPSATVNEEEGEALSLQLLCVSYDYNDVNG